MPATTSPLGFPYLGPGDDPDIAGISQQISQAVQTYLLGPAWITLPLASGVIAETSAGTSAGPYVPAYRVWGSGYVEYRGGMQRSSGTGFGSGATLFTIPTAAMPASIVCGDVLGTVSTSITTNARLELTPADGLCKIYANTGDYLFVNLDQLSYYTT